MQMRAVNVYRVGEMREFSVSEFRDRNSGINVKEILMPSTILLTKVDCQFVLIRVIAVGYLCR
jgi:hypothetical protein